MGSVHCPICGSAHKRDERCEYCTPANLTATFGEKYAAKLVPQPTCQSCGVFIDPARYDHHYCAGCAEQYLETCSGCQGNTGGTWANPHGCSDCYNTGLQEKSTKGANEMNIKEIVTLVQLTQGATVIAGVYLDNRGEASRCYHFKNVVKADLAVGDLAVVQTGDTVKLVKVAAVNVPHHQLGCNLADLKHVVQKVDTRQLDYLLDAEGKAANELALSELHERLEKMATQIGGTGFSRVQTLLGGGQPVEAKNTLDHGAEETNGRGDL